MPTATAANDVVGRCFYRFMLSDTFQASRPIRDPASNQDL